MPTPAPAPAPAPTPAAPADAPTLQDLAAEMERNQAQKAATMQAQLTAAQQNAQKAE